MIKAKVMYDINVVDDKDVWLSLLKDLASKKARMIPINNSINEKSYQPQLDILVLVENDKTFYRVPIQLSSDINNGTDGSNVSWDQNTFVVSEV